MKHLILTALCALFIAFEAACGVNKTLQAAQSMISSATTVAQCEAAKKKFRAAKFDAGYVAAEHDAAINRGLSQCDSKKRQLQGGGSSSTPAAKKPASGGGSGSRGGASATPARKKASRERPEIYKIDFANTDYDGNILNDYGSTLYADDMRYLKPRIFYRGMTQERNGLTLYVKFLDGDGDLMTGSGSPDGFSHTEEQDFLVGDYSSTMTGRGNRDRSAFVPGMTRVEYWLDGSLLGYGAVDIKPGSGGGSASSSSSSGSYLRVDGGTGPVASSFGSDGGTETFYVTTSASSWTTWGVPSWCEITSKGSGSFTISCQPNPSPNERNDYMEVRSDGLPSVRINFTQAGNANNIATIENVWFDQNVYQNGVKGMKVHIKARIKGYKGRPMDYHVWLYQEDDITNLKNSEGRSIYYTNTQTVNYDDSTFNDWVIFVPNNDIFSATNFTGSFAIDCTLMDENYNTIARSDNHQFSRDN